MTQHEPCENIKVLRSEFEAEKQIRFASWWKTLAAILVVVFGYGGCTTTVAMTYISRSNEEMSNHRKLIDINTEKISQSASKYTKLESTIESLLQYQKEQREDQKKIGEAVHRIEVILAGQKLTD